MLNSLKSIFTPWFYELVYRRGALNKIIEVRNLRRLIRHFNIDCVFDVGANQGQYALQLRKDVKFDGLIISFEPLPRMVDYLLSVSAGDKKWLIEPFALGENEGLVTINEMKGSQFSSIHRPREGHPDNQIVARHEVQQRSLLSVYGELKNRYGFKNPYLKMDTQGNDLKVFLSGIGVLDEIVAIQSELAFVPFYYDVPNYQESIRVYESHGFVLSSLFPNNSGNFPFLYEMDCIMVNKNFTE
jgi:FkbM family methyltransferase